jgi:hypothetical protein
VISLQNSVVWNHGDSRWTVDGLHPLIFDDSRQCLGTFDGGRLVVVGSVVLMGWREQDLWVHDVWSHNVFVHDLTSPLDQREFVPEIATRDGGEGGSIPPSDRSAARVLPSMTDDRMNVGEDTYRVVRKGSLVEPETRDIEAGHGNPGHSPFRVPGMQDTSADWAAVRCHYDDSHPVPRGSGCSRDSECFVLAAVRTIEDGGEEGQHVVVRVERRRDGRSLRMDDGEG